MHKIVRSISIQREDMRPASRIAASIHPASRTLELRRRRTHFVHGADFNLKQSK
ncbi:hypothetical protein [Sphingomonas sp. OK281]|uniref:hypothetical protein n=1 Tax=Sphingomonas sp. OK281 TaxID=1881067 RepID=UPI0015871F80|nr:hypothetical protein [Sphingomonas sp. OK281]